MGPLDVVTGDPFGIFQRRRVVWPATTVTVYPRLLEVSQFLPDAAHTVGDASVQGHYIDAPPDALGVRDHDASDGFNRIHWPSTARLGRLMSRTFERYEGSDILVLLDLDRSVHHGEGPDSSLERAMSLAASLVHAAIVRSQAVGLVANNRDAATFPPARGGEQLARILDFLAEARADGGSATFPRLKAAALTYSPDAMLIITPRPAGRWLEQLVAVDGRRGRARATVLHLNGQAREESAAPPTAAFARWWELGPNDPVFASAPGPTRGASTRLSVAS